MRRKYYTEKDVGKSREREIFLWWPMKFDGDWRWWEKVTVKESIHQVDVGGSGEWGNYAHCWCIDGFVDEV